MLTLWWILCVGDGSRVKADEGCQAASLLERVPPHHRVCVHHYHHHQYLRRIRAPAGGKQVEVSLFGSSDRLGRGVALDGGSYVDCVVSATVAKEDAWVQRRPSLSNREWSNLVVQLHHFSSSRMRMNSLIFFISLLFFLFHFRNCRSSKLGVQTVEGRWSYKEEEATESGALLLSF